MTADLMRLAEAYGVATTYEGTDDETVVVPPDTLVAVLAAMGVAAGSPAEREESLVRARTERAAAASGPTGEAGAGHADGVRCPQPGGRAWGWMAQLYALRSAGSWGIGDLADLRLLAVESARRHGAGFVLCNPLHAAAPVLPQQPSPYYPSSRRFTNPLWLRPEEFPEADALDGEARERLRRLAADAAALNGADRIDRDAVFRLKLAAFELLASAPVSADRAAAFEDYREAEGQGLEDFARYCALAERHGPRFQDWPEALRHPRNPEIAAAAAELADRVSFHAWLQWEADRQLAAVQAAALDAGMPIGVVHDLAVGVDPGGADAWALQDDLALGVTVGAPPDAFNQRGQDWRLPPLRPDRLAATGCAPFRELVARQLRHGGGLRIDHILGLFRLFWIPEGAPPSAGTYVRYPAEALLAVLVEEAARAGAVIVGEDLGNVERGVRIRLGEAGVLGSRVLYFERDEDSEARLAAAAYPRGALVSVTTHDLPTAPGWWADEDVRAQHAAGLLPDGTDLEAELARKGRDRAELRALLGGDGAGGGDDGEGAGGAGWAGGGGGAGDGENAAPVEGLAPEVAAMYRFLAATPCLLVGANPGDAVGDRRQPNLPGSTDEYPNWSLPLAAGGGPLGLEAFLDHPGTRAVAGLLRGLRTGDPRAG